MRAVWLVYLNQHLTGASGHRRRAAKGFTRIENPLFLRGGASALVGLDLMHPQPGRLEDRDITNAKARGQVVKDGEVTIGAPRVMEERPFRDQTFFPGDRAGSLLRESTMMKLRW